MTQDIHSESNRIIADYIAKKEAEKKAVARMEKKKEKEAKTAGLEYDHFREPIGKKHKKPTPSTGSMSRQSSYEKTTTF